MKTRKLLGFAAVLGLTFGVLRGCALPIGVESFVRKDPDPIVEGVYVVDYDLQNYVPVPTSGASPVTEAIRRDLELEVVWMDEEGADMADSLSAFDDGARYQAKITLRAKEDYCFDPEIQFRYPEGAVATQPKSNDDPVERKLTVVLYKPTMSAVPVTPVDLSAYIPAPTTGTRAVKFFAVAGHSGTVDWFVEGGEKLGGNFFLANTRYEAAVALRAAPGYSFAGMTGEFSYLLGDRDLLTERGTVSVSSIEGMVISGFPATEAEALTVTELDLSALVPAPATGGTPGGAFAAAQYTGAVTWAKADGSGIGAASFQSGTAYKAVVALTAASGRTFAGVGANCFIHAGAAGPPTNAAGSGVVTIVFPATGGEITAQRVSDLSLSYRVPAPVAGGTPVGAFAATQYTGAATWTTADGGAFSGAFQADTGYKAVVALTAEKGFTFSGAGQFTHSGAGSISTVHNDTTSAVTITFPPKGGGAVDIGVNLKW